MTTSQIREYVTNLYPGPKWRARVQQMTDTRVIAIYLEKQKHDKRKEGDK